MNIPQRMWINQPSTLQPMHHLHGTNVLAIPDTDSTMRIFFLSGGVVSQQAPISALSPGWRQEQMQIADVRLLRDAHRAKFPATAVVAAQCLTPPAKPFGYFHELLNHEGKGNGVWVGCSDRTAVEQSYTEGETGREIVALYRGETKQ